MIQYVFRALNLAATARFAVAVGTVSQHMFAATATSAGRIAHTI